MQTTITANTASPKQPTNYHRKAVKGMMLLARSYIKSEQHDHYKLTILLSDVIQVYTLNVDLSNVILLNSMCMIIQLFCLMRCIIHYSSDPTHQ